MSSKVTKASLIGKKKEILDANDNAVYDMHTLRVEFDSGKVRKVRAFAKPGSLDESDKEGTQAFIYDRLEDLMRAQHRTNYIFLGKLDKLGEKYTPSTRYRLSSGYIAEEFFNENVHELKAAVEQMEKEEKEELEDEKAIREILDKTLHGKKEPERPLTVAEEYERIEQEREAEEIQKAFHDILHGKKMEDPEELLWVDPKLHVFTDEEYQKMKSDKSFHPSPVGQIKRADVEKLKDPAYARKFRMDHGLYEIPEFLKNERKRETPSLVMPSFLQDHRPTSRTEYDRSLDYLEVGLRNLIARVELIKVQRSRGAKEADIDKEIRVVEERIADLKRAKDARPDKPTQDSGDRDLEL